MLQSMLQSTPAPGLASLCFLQQFNKQVSGLLAHCRILLTSVWLGQYAGSKHVKWLETAYITRRSKLC